MMPTTLHLRKARTRDAKAIHAMLLDCSRRGLLLPRSYNQIYTHIRDFHVAENAEGAVVGCCALAVSWEDLAEIRSLVVLPDAQGAGLGRRLVEICLSEADVLGVRRIFTLTYITDFFEKLGFGEVAKESLPQKVWSDCINCLNFPECNEHAMLLELSGAQQASPQPDPASST